MIDARKGLRGSLAVKAGPGRIERGLLMADGFVLEFEDFGREQYDAVNQRLGIDQASGRGDWPAGSFFMPVAPNRTGLWSLRSGSRGRRRNGS